MVNQSIYQARKTRKTIILLTFVISVVTHRAAIAQVTSPLQTDQDSIRFPDPFNTLSPESIPREQQPPSAEPIPEQPIQPLPPPSNILIPPSQTQEFDHPFSESADAFTVQGFRITGSTVFDASDFDPITQNYIGQTLTLAQVLEVRSAITDLYIDQGYITSGAYLPPQRIGKDGVVEIRVVEGAIEEITVEGNKQLRQAYIRQRLKRFTGTPLNQDRLLEGLQLLRLNPLIQNLRAELSAGVNQGTSVLSVRVEEAQPIHAQVTLDNDRAPSVGTFRRQLELKHDNLVGLGDGASVAYANTDGSHALDVSYNLPLTARDTTLSLSYGESWSRVIEDPFESLEIRSRSRFYELTLRHPLILKPTQELGVGLTASHRRSKSTLLENIPLPGIGTDSDGRTRVTALRFFQDYTKRSQRDVFALRSQFSVGVNALGATINANRPDSQFFAWRGQGQYVKLLAPDMILLLRLDAQASNEALVPIEQFGLGGSASVRGYRQDELLTDNGVFASAEARFPIFRPSKTSLLQLTPFIDFGQAWPHSGQDNPDAQTLASVGLGLQFQWDERLTARFLWGIPLVSTEGADNTLQENGLYFSVIYNPF